MGFETQFNVSTMKVMYNPETKKVLTAGLPCMNCDPTAPTKVKTTFAGTSLCVGLGVCCSWPHYKVIREGVTPLNGESILQRGFTYNRLYPGSKGECEFIKRVGWTESPIGWTCDFTSDIIEGDFGDIEVYQETPCSIYKATYTFYQKVINLHGHPNYWHLYLCLAAKFKSGDPEWSSGFEGFLGYLAFHWTSLFFETHNPWPVYPNCLPYDALLPNLLDCDPDNMPGIWGVGTGLIEVP